MQQTVHASMKARVTTSGRANEYSVPGSAVEASVTARVGRSSKCQLFTVHQQVL